MPDPLVDAEISMIVDSLMDNVAHLTMYKKESTTDNSDEIVKDFQMEISPNELNMNGTILRDARDTITHLENTVESVAKSEGSLVTSEPSAETMESDSPIKIKRKKVRNLIEDIEDSSNIETDVSAEVNALVDLDQNSESGSLIKLKKKAFRNISDELKENNKALDDIYDSEINMEEMEENSPAGEENENADSNLNFEATVPSDNKKTQSSLYREVKGKDLMKQALSLPYFQLPKPDFREYMNETNRRLEEPLLEKSTDSAKNAESSKKVMLKPVNNIVFEVGSSKMDKVEPFRKKVLGMMTRANELKSETANSSNGAFKKTVPTAIGAERLSWKMKLLNDIAKKKEAVLRERNEMLEEVLENNEEENHVTESESDDLDEDDEVNVHFPDAGSVISGSETGPLGQNSQETPKDIYQDNSHTMFCDTPDKDWDTSKEITSSPLCFSLPSFQPDGGFSKLADASSSNVCTSQINLSFNEESEKENGDLSRVETSELRNVFPLTSVSERDERVYDKVLAEEKLLANEQSMPGELMTADILDMCSGQFLDVVEVPKTPPLANISDDEELDMDVSDASCASERHPETGSDSESDEELNFKCKVLKKRIRPISPIDEESRHGEEDTQVHPASVLNEANSNFNFSKNLLSSPTEQSTDSESDNNDIEAKIDSTVNFNSDESVVYEGKALVKNIPEPTKTAQDYFDDEAELSGEEGSSDEDEGELEGEDALVFEDADLPENEELRDQIGTLHLKHLLDDDDQMIRQVKNHFLDEGELYSDAARQRKFNWSFNPTESANNLDLSGSDNEEEINEVPFQQDKLKWKQDNANTEISEVIETQTLEASFKIEVQRKISSQIVAQRETCTINKRPRNSFLDEDEAKKSFKKIKLDVINAQGTRATKNFVFVESNGPTKHKVSSHKNSVDNSVFDII